MKLEAIGYYTLTDERARQASVTSTLWRGEIIVTGRCNFKCIYCRGLPPEDIQPDVALNAIELWLQDGLKNIRFSGGEPALYKHLPLLVRKCQQGGVEKIGISTNGSLPFKRYEQLVQAGVNDITVSIDSFNSALADQVAGVKGKWERVITNIQRLSSLTYVAASIVLTEENVDLAKEIILFVHNLGVADIRIVTASHHEHLSLKLQDIPAAILEAHPILKYRVHSFRSAQRFRGLRSSDSHKCYLVLDDSVIWEKWHYPCGIYLREGGQPIGEISPGMRLEREKWLAAHDTHLDPLCSQFCTDMYISYNNRVAELAKNQPATE